MVEEDVKGRQWTTTLDEKRGSSKDCNREWATSYIKESDQEMGDHAKDRDACKLELKKHFNDVDDDILILSILCENGFELSVVSPTTIVSEVCMS